MSKTKFQFDDYLSHQAEENDRFHTGRIDPIEPPRPITVAVVPPECIPAMPPDMPERVRAFIGDDPRKVTAYATMLRRLQGGGVVVATDITQDGFISADFASEFLHGLADIGVIEPASKRRCQTFDTKGRVMHLTVWRPIDRAAA